MDRNLLLAIALSLAVWVLWASFQVPPPPADGIDPAGVPGPSAAPLEDRSADVARRATAPSLPAPSAVPPRARAGVLEPSLEPPPALLAGEAQEISVGRPLYRAALTSRGATLSHWELTEYHEGPDRGRAPIVLTGDTAQLALATPFDSLGLGDLSSAIYEIVSDEPERVEFRLQHADLTIRKVYEFGDGYEFRLHVELSNESDRPVTTRFPVHWPVHERDAPDFREQSLVALQAGSVQYELLAGLGKPGFMGMSAPQPMIEYAGEVDWAGSQTTYFLSVLVPDRPVESSARFVALEPGREAIAEVASRPTEIPPGRSASREYRGYLGPKEQDRLLAFGSETVRAIDLGWSWVAPLTRFFGWLLHALYSLIPNYGVAIIVLTVLVRVVTIPLTNKQMRSMERMRALSPKIKEIQEKFADDRQKLSEETMALYRREKVNPLGGCLPMVLQLPVFIGLFYALRSSIHLRQAPFVAWISDLSAPETLLTIPGLELPVRVLPLVMGGTMVVQQKLTPMPSMDPTQARLMTTFMPIMMTVVFYQFPSGLVLYWMVSNVLAIAHQRWIGRNIRAAD